MVRNQKKDVRWLLLVVVTSGHNATGLRFHDIPTFPNGSSVTLSKWDGTLLLEVQDYRSPQFIEGGNHSIDSKSLQLSLGRWNKAFLITIDRYLNDSAISINASTQMHVGVTLGRTNRESGEHQTLYGSRIWTVSMHTLSALLPAQGKIELLRIATKHSNLETALSGDLPLEKIEHLAITVCPDDCHTHYKQSHCTETINRLKAHDFEPVGAVNCRPTIGRRHTFNGSTCEMEIAFRKKGRLFTPRIVYEQHNLQINGCNGVYKNSFTEARQGSFPIVWRDANGQLQYTTNSGHTLNTSRGELYHCPHSCVQNKTSLEQCPW